MTGGRVVVLGRTGRNFAAGMSGGLAYVLDEDGRFASRCNMGLVELEALSSEDAALVAGLLEEHAELTGSQRARELLGAWEQTLGRFVKVVPVEYRRVLEARGPARASRTAVKASPHPSPITIHRRPSSGQGHGLSRTRAHGRAQAPGRRARARLSRARASGHPGAAGGPGRSLHGLRNSLLQHRMPAGEPDPRLERPRLPRALRPGHRRAARHQQFPRGHRPGVPRALRSRVRVGHHRRPGEHQADRKVDRGSGHCRGRNRAATGN